MFLILKNYTQRVMRRSLMSYQMALVTHLVLPEVSFLHDMSQFTGPIFFNSSIICCENSLLIFDNIMSRSPFTHFDF